MAGAPKKPERPIGDPPTRKRAVRADQRVPSKQPDIPMMDPFTEQSTHAAGEGQGANAPQDRQATSTTAVDSEEDEETMPIEEGFSSVP